MIKELLLSLSLQTPVVLDRSTVDTSPVIQWVIDHEQSMSPEDALAAFARGQGQKSARGAPNLGYVQSPVFALIPIKNEQNASEYIIECAYPLVDSIKAFLIDDKQILSLGESGDGVPFRQRAEFHRTPNFRFHLHSPDVHYLLLKMESSSSMQFPVFIYTRPAFNHHAVIESIALGGLSGVILVMVIFYGFLYLSLKERVYLWYVLYLLSFLAFQMNINGMFFQFLVPRSPGIADRLLPHLIFSSFTFGQLFTSDFLQLKIKQPKLHRFYVIMTLLTIGCQFLSLVIPFSISTRLAVGYAMIGPILLIYAGIQSWLSGFHPARFFVLGWAVFVTGIFLYGLKSTGMLPFSFVTEYAMPLGAMLEVSLLSLALADRIQQLQENSNQATAKLIEGYKLLNIEVSRRVELEEANNKLAHEMKIGSEQLVQAEKMVMLGQLVAGIAHDIASPAQLIKLSLDETETHMATSAKRLATVFQGVDDPEAVALYQNFQRDFSGISVNIREMKTGLEHINSIQNAIRNQSRVDAGFQQVEIRPLIQECQVILKSRIRGRTIEIDCQEGALLLCRRSQIGQVLTNLMANACDALDELSHQSRDDRPDLLITVHNLDDHQLSIQVEDDGPGIPESMREKIFQTFYTTKAVGKGTGLGLSICQRVLNDHQGILKLGIPIKLKGAAFLMIFHEKKLSLAMQKELTRKSSA